MEEDHPAIEERVEILPNGKEKYLCNINIDLIRLVEHTRVQKEVLKEFGIQLATEI